MRSSSLGIVRAEHKDRGVRCDSFDVLQIPLDVSLRRRGDGALQEEWLSSVQLALDETIHGATRIPRVGHYYFHLFLQIEQFLAINSVLTHHADRRLDATLERLIPLICICQVTAVLGSPNLSQLHLGLIGQKVRLKGSGQGSPRGSLHDGSALLDAAHSSVDVGLTTFFSIALLRHDGDGRAPAAVSKTARLLHIAAHPLRLVVGILCFALRQLRRQLLDFDERRVRSASSAGARLANVHDGFGHYHTESS